VSVLHAGLRVDRGGMHIYSARTNSNDEYSFIGLDPRIVRGAADSLVSRGCRSIPPTHRVGVRAS